MNNLNFLGAKTQWHLLKWCGIYHPFFNVTVPTIVATWVALLCILCTILVCNYFLSYKKGLIRHSVILFIKGFMDLCSESLGGFKYNHFSFITALFLFILYCNLAGVLPFFEEATADLNTTLSLGIVSFIYINFYAIRAHGIKNYFKEFFQPFKLMFPLNIIGKLSGIVSISFRLFGNILGGSIITTIFMTSMGSTPSAWYFSFVPVIGVIGSILISMFFGIFEGFIQAFIFSMLSLTYLSLESYVEEPPKG